MSIGTITSPCSRFTTRNLFTSDFNLPIDTCKKTLTEDTKTETYPSLQHSHIDHDIEEAFNRDESLESCGEVEIKTEIRSELFLFNSGCGDSDTHSAHLRFIPGIWVVVEPECDGDQDDGEDEEDEDADADVDQEASHHAVGCVDLHKVDFFLEL